MDQQLIATIQQVMWETSRNIHHQRSIMPSCLRYYLLASHTKDQKTCYGIGIEKETEINGVVHLEKKMICDVFSNKTDCQDFLNKLIHNIVSPITLSDVIVDEIA